jgi:CRISPR-associated exonuclease Cas4
MNFAESDLFPLSALQHYLFCPRQCALIHVEQIWAENRLTAEGRILHDRVDAGGMDKRKDVKRVFGLPIRSLRIGVSGKADVVEFHRQADGCWLPYPVEHKRGRRKKENWDRIQLCAQAICLEEMLNIVVPAGALFYGKEQHREVVYIEDTLRQETESVAEAVHVMLAANRTPAPVHSAKCDNCSLVGICLPKTISKPGNKVAHYLVDSIRERP